MASLHAPVREGMGVTDDRLEFIQGLLEKILTELRIMNAHLAMGSGQPLNESDLEGEVN